MLFTKNILAVGVLVATMPWRLREWTRPPAREWTHGV